MDGESIKISLGNMTVLRDPRSCWSNFLFLLCFACDPQLVTCFILSQKALQQLLHRSFDPAKATITLSNISQLAHNQRHSRYIIKMHAHV